MKKFIILSFFIILFIQNINAQSNKTYLNLNIGYPVGVFDIPNRGIHIAMHPTLRLNQILALETALAFNFIDFRDDRNSFFEHDTAQIQTISFVVGPKIYFLKEKYKVRPYFNCMLGLGYMQEKSRGIISREWNFDLYTTLNVDIKKFNIGIGLETVPQTFLIKGGYRFN